MNDIEMERLYRDMAASYSESCGARLKRELAELEASGSGLATEAFERRLRGRLRARRRRTAVWISVAAACVILLVLLPALPGRLRVSAPPHALLDEPGQYDVIPLGFSLPEGFAVTEVEQDREKTVYYLSVPLSEGIVMTLERASGPIPAEGLVRVPLDGKQAYGLETGDYGILLVQDDGILYTMTCRRGMDRLLELGGSI